MRTANQNGGAYYIGNCLQDHIASQMSMGVIDVLTRIDIQQKDSEVVLITICASYLVLDLP